MKKLAILLLAIIILIPTLASCAGKNAGEVNIALIKGPTGMGMAHLMENAPDNYKFTVESAPDMVTAALLNGSVDIAALPVNLAAVLYNKNNGDFQIAAINTLGVLYILENGNTVNSVSDLRGKTVYATAQGSTTEYILNYILAANGLTPGVDVTVEFMSEHAELAAALASGAVSIGMLPEPNVTAALANSDKLRVALDLNAEWGKTGEGGGIVQGCIVVRKEFLENNKKAVDDFLAEYKKSIEFVNSNHEEAAKLIVKHGVLPGEDQARAAIPGCNIVYISGNEMKERLDKFFAVLYGANPASIGGALPDEGIYYIK